jgi:hypothetical protein
MARPIPVAPPVISAIFPASLIVSPNLLERPIIPVTVNDNRSIVPN